LHIYSRCDIMYSEKYKLALSKRERKFVMSDKKEKAVKKSDVRKKKDGVRVPSGFLYKVGTGLLRPVLNGYYRNTITREGLENIDGPCVVLSNHCSRVDWALVGLAMLPRKLNIVITRYYYSIPALRFFLKRLGTIPKDQFSPDVAAIKSMLSAAKQGGNIMLFPEGRMTPGGVSETFERSTVKLLRHLKLPVVAVHLYGVYMTWPKWAKTLRRGKMETKVQLLLTPEKMAEMTDDELYEYMVNALKTDEAAWQAEHRVAYKGKRFAEGLSDVLFICPKCGAQHTNVSEKDVIRCTACGNGARLNEYYDLVPLDETCVIPSTIGEWHTMQIEQVRRAIEDGSDACMTSTATLLMTGEKKWLTPMGEGTIRADEKGFSYSGTRNGQPFEVNVPISALSAVAFSQGHSFELFYKGEFYSFEPTRGVEAQKWSMFIEQMHSYVEEKQKAQSAQEETC